VDSAFHDAAFASAGSVGLAFGVLVRRSRSNRTSDIPVALGPSCAPTLRGNAFRTRVPRPPSSPFREERTTRSTRDAFLRRDTRAQARVSVDSTRGHVSVPRWPDPRCPFTPSPSCAAFAPPEITES